MCIDALERDESAGAHFREEHRPQMAKRYAMTKTMPPCLPGNFKAMDNRRNYIASLSISKLCISHKGVTSERLCHSERSRGIPLR